MNDMHKLNRRLAIISVFAARKVEQSSTNNKLCTFFPSENAIMFTRLNTSYLLGVYSI